MATRVTKVGIKGVSPLLMHAFPMVEIPGLEKKSPDEQAEYAAYRTQANALYLPGIAIQRGLVAAATFSKGKGRASLQKTVAACVLVEPEQVDLGTKTYQVDSRPVVIPATKGRVMRHRPRLDEWAADFLVSWDDEMLTEKQLRIVVDDLGRKVGLLDFRPERKGPFGRFMVTNWE